MPRWSRLMLATSLLACSAALAARPYRGGVVATAQAVASKAALEMLDQGGNAVDAAVAAAFALAVVDPIHTGLGGGGFAIFYDASTGRAAVHDFREVAPQRASRDMFLRNGKPVPELSTDGALAVAVPGAVAGYLELLSKYGKLKPARVLASAIRAARNGFRVSPLYQALAQQRLACVRAHPETARIFLRPNAEGQPDVPPVGTLLRQTDLAKTLEQIAREGARAFYTGRIGQSIVEVVQREGGLLAREDLARFKTRSYPPLAGSYRGHRILTIPPPSAGGLAILQVLGVWELRKPTGFDYHDVEAIHLYAETLRRIFLARMKYLGDPAQVDVPLARLTSKEYLREISASIDLDRATPSQSLLPANALPAVPDGGVGKSTMADARHTAHVSVIDRQGNAVGLTTTINYYFGSCLVAPGTGVLLNDQMDDFSVAPMVANAFDLVTGEPNAVAPGKVPLSSMAPTLVFQKEDPSRVQLVVGAAGGPTIPTSVVQVISNVIDQQMDLARAVGEGRVHHQFLPDRLRIERYALDPATVKLLEAKGHQVERQEKWGETEAVMEAAHAHLRYSASDPRNEGAALGQD